MPERKEIRKRARHSLRSHYWIFVFACLLAAILGTDYSNSLHIFQIRHPSQIFESNAPDSAQSLSADIYAEDASLYNELINNDPDNVINSLKYRMEVYSGKDTHIGDVELGHSRGVLSSIVNMVESGALLYHLLTLFDTILGSNRASVILAAVLGFCLMLVFWTFVINVYRALYARIFLEGRLYEKVPVSRMGFLYRIKRHAKASLSMAVCSLLSYLWLFTIVLYPVKRYAYLLVPYLVAENPDIAPMEAIRLSARMMKGHKWEAFCLELSLLPWSILASLTGGLVGILFANPYNEAVFAEYYACIRQNAVAGQLEGSERLNDRYLFELPDTAVLQTAYADIRELAADRQPLTENRTGLRGILERHFGVVLSYDQSEKEFRKQMLTEDKIEEYADILDGKIYPSRLFPIPEKSRRSIAENTGCLRHYSLPTLILMFFIGSLTGWIWEVIISLLQGGAFVNRGVLHGPWLPIYGGGMLLILTILYRFRRKPFAEFWMIVLLCGTVEYLSSWVLETLHHGEKWWDYSGYYLNLNGRISAEGLLVFGIGGMAFIYVTAPLLDNLIERIRTRILWPLCAALLILFTADIIYSSVNPNTGEGITTVSDKET